MPIDTDARNTDLQTLADMLKRQHAVAHDAVVPATAIRSVRSVIEVAGISYETRAGLPGHENSVTRLAPTRIADGHLADKLGIPLPYLRRMHETRTDLYDGNINGWLHGADGISPDRRKFFVRTFIDDDDPGGVGVLRAVLSDTYRPVDNLDALTAALAGIRDSGVDARVVSADLTETRMVVRVAAPEIAALAPTLLAGYRSPNSGWTIEQARAVAAREGKGYPPGQEPVVFAGFELSNSETGGGAFMVTPRLVVQVCRNGLKISADALRTVHLGARMDAGILWSDDTRRRNVDLVKAQATDAVRTFLRADYLEGAIAGLERKAGVEIARPADTVRLVGKELRFSDAETDAVLDLFIRGGQTTAAGVLNAVTALAGQDSTGADRAYELENVAVRAMQVAAAAA